MRFPISFNRPMSILMGSMGMGPRRADIDVGEETLTVRMGWGFHCAVPRTSVRSATVSPRRVISMGVHGWRGRWLVNGSGKGLVVIAIDPAARARVLGVPVSLRELTVSVADPARLAGAIGQPTEHTPN